MDGPSLAWLGRMLLVLALLMAIAGLMLIFWDKLPLSRIPLGRLPGDIHVQGPKGSFYFPWVTCLVVSIIVSLLLYLFRR